MAPTTKERLRAEIAALRRRAEHAAAAGDTAGAAALLQEAAPLLVASGSPDDAVSGLRRALSWHEAAGRVAEVARAHYALGLLLGRQHQSIAAQASFSAALDGFRALGAAAMEGRAHAQLATLMLRHGDPAAAVGALAAAAGSFGRAGDLDRLLDTLRLLTFALQLDGRPEEAYRWLLRAFEIAHAAGADAAHVFAIDLRNLAGSPLAREQEPDGLADVLRAAAQAGSPAVRAYALLTEAGDAEDLEAALEAASAARGLALEAADPVVYLLACLQDAALREEAGDRPAALTTLYTCAASLGDLAGEEARKPVYLVIDALRGKWGEDAYQTAMTAYRAQFGA